MPAKKKPKPMTSSARLMAAGMKPVQLWLTQEQHDLIFAAAEKTERKATQFIVFSALQAAKEIVK